jgi:4-aminobutyrate aminotransferase-like enzyme
MAGWDFNMKPVSVPKVKTKHRRIVTKLPAPESLKILAKMSKYESVSMHGQMPLVWDKAKDFSVYDAWGNKWIDFTSTIFVTNAGHGNKRIVKAIKDVIEKPLLHTYTYASKERVDYLEYLIKHTPRQFGKAYLVSAGTEATECALKLMRMHGFKKGKKKPGIISFEGNWHGRTMGAQMLGFNPAQKEWIGYLDPNIYHLPFPYPWRKDAADNPAAFFRNTINKLLMEKNLNPDTDLCGFMLETFQGWGAVFYPEDFVKEVEKFAREHKMLLSFDEMQAGFGRTGKLFGYMHYNVEPDLICCGKGASSSVPLSIVLGRTEIMDLPEAGSMSSTHSANPMVCAAGKANLKALLNDGLIDNSEKLGKYFHKRLNELMGKYSSVISHVNGRGLLAALIFMDKNGKPLCKLASVICETAMQSGLLLVHTGRESIKMAPPLCITKDALDEGLEVLEDSIKSALKTCVDSAN